jgi:hypothetical protein
LFLIFDNNIFLFLSKMFFLLNPIVNSISVFSLYYKKKRLE